jgi:hypothetical protein
MKYVSDKVCGLAIVAYIWCLLDKKLESLALFCLNPGCTFVMSRWFSKIYL